MIDSETVLGIISHEAALDRARLVPSATLDELSIASLDVINILFAIEDKCGVEFNPAEFEGVRTLDEFVKVVMSKVNAGAPAAVKS